MKSKNKTANEIMTDNEMRDAVESVVMDIKTRCLSPYEIKEVLRRAKDTLMKTPIQSFYDTQS